MAISTGEAHVSCRPRRSRSGSRRSGFFFSDPHRLVVPADLIGPGLAVVMIFPVLISRFP
jgi:hypothetical protein